MSLDLKPTLLGFKRILKALEDGIKNPDQETREEIERLRKYIARQDEIAERRKQKRKPVLIPLKVEKWKPPKAAGYEVTIWTENGEGDVNFMDATKRKDSAKKVLKKAIERYPNRNCTLFRWYEDGSKDEVIDYYTESKTFKDWE